MTPRDERMTFGAFTYYLKQEIDGFHAWWGRCGHDNPRLFPQEMTPTEWREQFMIWMGSPTSAGAE
jgi:hypothetical protein